MARACGLRIGPRRFELVVLDGNPRKHKIVAYMAGELPPPEDGGFAPAVAALREAARKHHVPRDNVGVAVDTGMAAFRTLRMPFADRPKIEQVLKFEVESHLSQWNIDEVIVDFHVLESSHGSSELLITAVPKAELRQVITVCEKAGIDPLECELETTAMVNAACVADVCQLDDAEVLVHVGEHSTSVVVMDGGRVREMRAIHIGALTHLQGLQPTQDEAPESEEPPEEGPADEEPAQDAADPDGPLGILDEPQIDPLEVQLRIDQSIKRIRRELGRTISAARTAHPITSVYVCGLEMPGLVGASVLDVPIQVLDVFEEDGGQPAEGFGALVVPYGVAVRQLGGGVLKPSLRREELRYAGKLEKVELPLAVVCLLVVTFLGIWNIFNHREWQDIDVAMKVWRDSTRNFVLPDSMKAGYLQYPSDDLKQYVAVMDTDPVRNKFEQMTYIRSKLTKEIADLEKELGRDADITQPQSALDGLGAVLDVFAQNGDRVGRPSFRKLQATYQAGRGPGRPEHVRVSLDLTFFAENTIEATENYEEGFVSAVQSKPWFADIKQVQSEPLENGEGIYLQGLAVNVDTTKLPRRQAGEPEGGTR